MPHTVPSQKCGSQQKSKWKSNLRFVDISENPASKTIRFTSFFYYIPIRTTLSETNKAVTLLSGSMGTKGGYKNTQSSFT